jgi:hypothetical protein
MSVTIIIRLNIANSNLAANVIIGDGRMTYGASRLLREQTLILFVFGRVRYRTYARERAG